MKESRAWSGLTEPVTCYRPSGGQQVLREGKASYSIVYPLVTLQGSGVSPNSRPCRWSWFNVVDTKQNQKLVNRSKKFVGNESWQRGEGNERSGGKGAEHIMCIYKTVTEQNLQIRHS